MPQDSQDSLDRATPNVDVGEQLAALGIVATGDAAFDAALLRLATTPLRRRERAS